jgi:adenylate cyclase
MGLNPRIRGRFWWALLSLPLAFGLGTAAGWTDFLEERVARSLLLLRGEIEAPLKLIYVDVDSHTVESFGASPNRAIFAAVADALLGIGGARGVGFDFIFSEFGHEGARAGNRQLRHVVEKYPGMIVLAGTYATGMGAVREQAAYPFRYLGFRDPEQNDLPELPEFNAAGLGARIGLIDVVSGSAFAPRAPLFVEARGARYLHMGLQLALLHWELDPEAIQIDTQYRSIEIRGADGNVVRRIPLLQEQMTEVNWHSPWVSPLNPRWSLVEVAYHIGRIHRGSEEEQSEARAFLNQFQDAIVLIGPVDPAMGDMAITPFDRNEPAPKVAILGNLLKTIVGGSFIRRLDPWVEGLFVFLLGAAVIPAFSLPWAKARYWAAGAGVVVAVAVAAGIVLFVSNHWILPLAGIAGSTVATAGVASAIRMGWAERQKRRVQGMFGSYVSPELVRQLVAGEAKPELGGEEREITVLFSDIAGFSTFSEVLPPSDLVAVMNEYFSAMTEIILAEGGTLDKYIGDAIVAFFGSPVPLEDHALRACRVAIRMQERQGELRRHWEAEGRWPDLVTKMRTRLGLNSGRAIAGNIGSRQRFNYTVMGDTVNIAARLEQLGKEMGCWTLVTAETRRQAESRGGAFLFRRLGVLPVKGREGMVEIHELAGEMGKLPAGSAECVAAFEEGTRLWEKGCSTEAAALFSLAAASEPGLGAGPTPSEIWLARCRAASGAPDGPTFPAESAAKSSTV